MLKADLEISAQRPMEVVTLVLGDFNALPVGAAKVDLFGKKIFSAEDDRSNHEPGKWNKLMGEM
eukprot:10394160-Karenia_brevis.AAC.1